MCDMFPDCKQEEDEEVCHTLEVPANYQKQVAPTEGSRGIPWPVSVSFEIRWGPLTSATFMILCLMHFRAFTEIGSIVFLLTSYGFGEKILE